MLSVIVLRVLPTKRGFGSSFLLFHIRVCPPADLSLLGQSLIGGALGGATVLVGVLVAEYLARKRERANRFDDAFWDTYAQAVSVFNTVTNPTLLELQRYSATFLTNLGRMRSEARRPLPSGPKIAAEIDQIVKRYHDAEVAWQAGGPVPDVKEIIGNDLARLAKRSENWWNV